METKKQKGLVTAIKNFKAKHPDLFEFILFNIMSNVATIVNFIVLWIGTGFLFSQLAGINFHWFIFNYSTAEGGLSSFLSFLLAYVCAQIVNFFIQRKFVFSATIEIRKVLPLYILTVVFAGLISVWLPPHIIKLTQPFIHGLAPTLANVVNIVLQVVINYPMMKFKIMKKE